MFDKILFDKICSIECTLDELKDFFDGIEDREFDTDAPFDKYYRIDTVRMAFELYRNGKINAEFLRYWANAYDLIIKGGFFSAELTDENETNQDQLIKSEISGLLDSISFIDEPEISELDYYLEMLSAYDGMLG